MASHGHQTRDELQSRHTGLLPYNYDHVVTTGPEELHQLFPREQNSIYVRWMIAVTGAFINRHSALRQYDASP